MNRRMRFGENCRKTFCFKDKVEKHGHGLYGATYRGE